MRVNDIQYRTVWMEGGVVKAIDQNRLPFAFSIISLRTHLDTAKAIKDMAIRGAGAIGVAAGYAVAQAALNAPGENWEEAVTGAAKVLRSTRPTARNLFYAIERVLAGIADVTDVAGKRVRAVEVANAIADEDASACERIGQVGQVLFGPSTTVLTHCNAGWLAFADWGTALAPIYRAKREGKQVNVYTTETRPRSQGAKLTAWELSQEGVLHTLIPDTAAGYLMRQGKVDLVMVGADRIAANGDVANKIGTYTLAVLAKTHNIPFYVAAPTMTIDLACPSGEAIPIEERSDDEVAFQTGLSLEEDRQVRVRIAPRDCKVKNWAFDVTPAEYVSGILTERGLIEAHPKAIQDIMRGANISVET